MNRNLMTAMVALSLAACPQPLKPDTRVWQTVAAGLDESVMGISGSSENDVWAV